MPGMAEPTQIWVVEYRWDPPGVPNERRQLRAEVVAYPVVQATAKRLRIDRGGGQTRRVFARAAAHLSAGDAWRGWLRGWEVRRQAAAEDLARAQAEVEWARVALAALVVLDGVAGGCRRPRLAFPEAAPTASMAASSLAPQAGGPQEAAGRRTDDVQAEAG